MSENRATRDNLLKGLALCGVAIPIVFAVLVTVGGFIYEGYSHVTQAVSELPELRLNTRGSRPLTSSWLAHSSSRFPLGFIEVSERVGVKGRAATGCHIRSLGVHRRRILSLRSRL